MEMTETSPCAYLRPNVGAPPSALSIAVYCGLPSGRARIPSRDELLRFCVTGSHGDCPGYRRARHAETFVHSLV
jgi:hypothetical protein